MVKREGDYFIIPTDGNKPVKVYFPEVNKERIEAIKEYYDSHDISIVRDPNTGNLKVIVRPVDKI